MNKDKVRKLKINFTNNSYTKGEIVKVKVDEHGTPFSSFWRRRLDDAKRDNCVEWVGEKNPMKQTSTKMENT